MCQFYRRLKRNPNYPVIIGVLSVGAFALGAATLVLLDIASGSLEQRMGLRVWSALLTGMTFAVVFNVAVGLVGILCGEE
ncbi:MAG: hypothetical protein NZ951_00505 [Dehalococcoidia bacterium]|nr:hypothetical protein [Dehalococcoidia bacterium]MDW8119126.1 hypothetical protein [Chloroflexota bacterium]